MILDLGCGPNKTEGAIGIDIYPFEGVDYVRDLNRGLPFSDSTVDTIIARQILEHLEGSDFMFVVNEMWRVSKPDAEWLIVVPDAYSPNRYRDPTHKIRDFSEDSFMLWEVDAENEYLIFVGPEYNRQAKLNVVNTEVINGKTRDRAYQIRVIK